MQITRSPSVSMRRYHVGPVSNTIRLQSGAFANPWRLPREVVVFVSSTTPRSRSTMQIAAPSARTPLPAAYKSPMASWRGNYRRRTPSGSISSRPISLGPISGRVVQPRKANYIGRTDPKGRVAQSGQVRGMVIGAGRAREKSGSAPTWTSAAMLLQRRQPTLRCLVRPGFPSGRRWRVEQLVHADPGRHIMIWIVGQSTS
jgi:hypothetical protein